MTDKLRLTIEQLKQERCFIELTPKQQLMIETFIKSDGDRVLSILTAYNAKTPEVARVMAYEFFESPKVIACLTAYYQDDPLDVFKREVQRAWRNKHLSVAHVQAMKLYCDIHGWGSRSLPDLHGRDRDSAPTPTPEVSTARESVQSSIPIFPPKYKVGTIANDPDDGKPYIILAVSTDGSEVTDARELTQKDDGTFVDSIAKGTSPTANHVPPGATPYADKSGVVRGYKTSDGKWVRLADVEAL